MVPQSKCFAQGFPPRRDVVRIVNQAVKDGICQGRIFHRCVPPFHGNFAGRNGEPTLVSSTEQLQKVAQLRDIHSLVPQS